MSFVADTWDPLVRVIFNLLLPSSLSQQLLCKGRPGEQGRRRTRLLLPAQRREAQQLNRDVGLGCRRLRVKRGARPCRRRGAGGPAAVASGSGVARRRRQRRPARRPARLLHAAPGGSCPLACSPCTKGPSVRNLLLFPHKQKIVLPCFFPLN
ncbi:unnamed protein product [Urochloa humidicola]